MPGYSYILISFGTLLSFYIEAAFFLVFAGLCSCDSVRTHFFQLLSLASHTSPRMRISTFCLAIAASLAALTSAIPSPDGHHKHHHLPSGCHVGKPAPPSTRCYTEVAATSPKHKAWHRWNTQWTSCTVTATCTTTVTSTPTYVLRVKASLVIQDSAERPDPCRNCIRVWSSVLY